MKKKVVVGAVVGLIALMAPHGVASADTATVTANITAGGIGVRSLTSVPAVVLTPALGVATVQGSMTAVVTETAVTGTNPWSVTAALSPLALSGQPNIAASNVDISNRSTVKVAGGGTVSNPSGTQDMSASRTISTNTGQSTSSIYTGVYTTTADLALNVPNGTVAGIYTGTLTVTLVQ